MRGPQGWEFIIILVLVLVLFGGAKIPQLARNLGRAQKEFKDGMDAGASEAPDPESDRTV
jgi:sec-independent protein translocase protein TatA